MRGRLAACALLAALAGGCADGGRFGQNGLPGTKKQAKADKQSGAGDKPEASQPDDSDDQADQPVQITGTYLTCGEVEPPDASHAVYGCKLARQGTGETVELRQVAKSWAWSYVLANDVKGSVETKPQPEGNEWQVHFDIAAEGLPQVEKLMHAVKVVLDLVLLPDGKKAISASEQLDVLLGNKPETTNGVVVPNLPAQPIPTEATADLPDSAPVPPAPAPAPAGPPSIVETTPGAGDVTAPTVEFKIAPKGANFALLAALNDATGVSDLQIAGGGDIVLDRATPLDDGRAIVSWSVVMRVSLKKGGKTCAGEGAIGPSMSILTFCR